MRDLTQVVRFESGHKALKEAVGGMMVGAMKWLALCAVALLAAASEPAVNRAELVKIQTVYLLPMANGFDQYLANQLTALGVYRVTTDPTRADAFFTDRVGAEFEERVAELLPETKKPEPEKKKSDADSVGVDAVTAPPPVSRSFGRGRGNLYLVARETRFVLWSTFGRAKDTQPKHMDDLAGKLVLRLKREISEPSKP